jgi:drug/metabolite transporter (DMT)-like permease
MSVLDFLSVRFSIAALVLLILLWRPVRRLSRSDLVHGALLGLVYGVAQVLQTDGLAHTPASVSGFVTGMYVVFTPLLGWLILRERLGIMVWVAVFMATIGLGVLSLHGFAISTGVLLILASALLYAFHIIGLGRWSRSDNALGLSVAQIVVIAIVCTVAAAPGGIGLPATSGGWASLLFMARVAGALALLLQTWAQAHLTAARTAIIMVMEPVWAALFAVLFGGESLTARMLIGGILVVSAMYVVELGPRKSADTELPHLAG